MPWHETNAVNERMRLMAALLEGGSMTEVCAEFGVSRKTGYKLARRFAEDGLEGLRDRSRSPRSHPNQTPPEIEAAVLRVRKAHPTWGSKKILAVLERDRPGGVWPARSTVDAILKRAGVVEPRGKRRRRQPSSAPFVDVSAPNELWTMDYKGWFRLGDGRRCDPLTVNDQLSRFSIECRAMVSPKLEDVRARLERAFRRHGLPDAMLSDCGPPFGSTGLGRLSRLSVWLLRLGVLPRFIQPARPDQNGRHERFHATLKRETASPPEANLRAQQRAFDRFTETYNHERPHEALGMLAPADFYEASPCSFPTSLPDHEYDDALQVRRVRPDGSIKWGGANVFLGEAMRREVVGLEQAGDGVWLVQLGRLRLGMLHERSRTVVPLPPDAAM